MTDVSSPISNAPTTTEAPTNTAPETSSSGAADNHDIDSDPNESFSDYIARTTKAKEAKKTEKPAEKKPTSIFDLDEKNKTEESDSKEPVLESSEEKKAVEKAIEQALKVGDKEYKASDIEKLSKDYETATASAKDFESRLNQLSDEVREFVNQLKTDASVFGRLQIPKEVIEQYYYETYVEPTIELTAEQKAAKFDELQKQQKAEKEERSKKEAKEAEERKAQELQNHYQQKWTSEIQEIVNSGNLPKTEFVLQRVAGYIRQAIDKNLYHLSSQDIVKAVSQDVQKLQADLLKNMTPEQLKQALGEDGYKKIREEEVKQYQASNKLKSATSAEKVETKSTAPKKRYSSVYDLLD